MSVNGWFPHINKLGAVVSGNAGIWVNGTPISPVGTTPVWCGFAPVYNNNDGASSTVNGQRVPHAYNDYTGSDDYRWAGFASVGAGRIDKFENTNLVGQFSGACFPRYGGARFCWLAPFQTAVDGIRKLYANGGVVATGVINRYAISPGGEVLVYTVATGTYTRKVLSEDGKDLSVRTNEETQAAFLGPGGQPWLMTQTPDVGTLVYPAFSPFGYQILGDLFYPEARMQDGRLRVVGSSGAGVLRELWIDFNAPRKDLRLL